MALKKTLAQRLFNISRISRPSVTGGCRATPGVEPSRGGVTRSQPPIEHDPGDNGVFRRFLHKRAVLTPELQWVPVEDGLRERLRALDGARGGIRLDGLVAPLAPDPADRASELTAEDARKLLKVAQLEVVRARLREIRETWVTYQDFVRVCGEACSDPGHGVGLAKLLDESGNVVVLGNMVLLKPDLEF